MSRTPIQSLLGLVLAVALVGCGHGRDDVEHWLPSERAAIQSLWIESLAPLPPSPGNPVADDPRAVELGHRIFFDPRFSANEAVACANCHQPARNFKDGAARSQGIGQTARKSMSVVGVAYSPWLFWDGRRDSLWAQALEPLEDPVEHGSNRVDIARLISSDADYRRAYTALFGALPELADSDRFPSASPRRTVNQRAAWDSMEAADQRLISEVFANVGRALGAYQRQLVPGPAPFDAFAEALLAGDRERANTHLDADQRRGLRLFLGRANCIHCHNGPLFTNNEFHNTGLAGPGMLPADRGRADGVKLLQADAFNCLGPFSPSDPEDCAELRFVKTSGVELIGAFRTVSLRNIAGSGPFMHTGQFETLTEVLNHYNLAHPTVISRELQPLRLTPTQIQQVIAFLESLSAPLATPEKLLRAPQPAQPKTDLGSPQTGSSMR